MAQRNPLITFENVPLEEARRMGQGSRIDPDLYHALKANIQSLGNTATRITFPEGTRPTTMNKRLLRVAAELNIPLTIRKGPGGFLFWRSTNEDLTQAKEVSQRIHTAQRKSQARPSRRRA